MNTRWPAVKHVVWDWNGTLLDDTALCIEIMNELLGERDLPQLDKARYQEIFDFPVVDYYARLGFDFSRDPFHLIGAEFIRRYEARRTEARLHAAATSTLTALRAAGFSQSVLSAYKHDTLESLLAHFEVRGFFGDVLGSDDVYAHGKVEQGRAWIRTRAIDPRHMLLIGDTRHDFEVAVAMGCHCLLVADGYHPRSKLEPLGAPVVDDLSGVCKELGVGR
ncbi:MAG TPA: HAD family hydrolase [Kiritimatiellia bacterium]|nr:HAD family hydrolase [Kiritimatiellia bacterium]